MTIAYKPDATERESRTVVRKSRTTEKHKEGYALLEVYPKLTDITYAPTFKGKERWFAKVTHQDRQFSVTLWQEHVDFLQICDIGVPDGETRHIKYADEMRVGVGEYDRKWGHAGIDLLVVDGWPFLEDTARAMYVDEFSRHPDYIKPEAIKS